MSLSRIKVWIAGEVLTASDLNTEFNNILSNPTALISPLTAALDLDGNVLTLDAAGVTTVASTAALSWNFTSGAKAGTPSTTGSIANWSAQTFTDSATTGSGTATAWVGHALQRPTLAATNASVTTTTAATLYIANAPAAGTNETITKAYALWIDDGAVRFDPSAAVVSAASATLDAFAITAQTATISGSTNITTATGFNYVSLGQPTLSAASALTVTNAATFYIANAPTGAGAGPATITNAYALWVDAGNTRLDGDATISGNMSAATISGAMVATQAQQETGTASTVVVTPSNQQFHTSAAKAWLLFNGTGTPAVTVSYNMDSSITDNATGDYTLSITTDFSSADFVFAGSARNVSGGAASVMQSSAAAATAGTIRIVVSDSSGGGTTIDSTRVSVIFFGDQ